ncbi:unnamed protein product [Brassica rapa]|uniref:Uncharacterized protein n=2 Tax=Brassica TaxID=3705 RepID=A0A3P6AH18_BRACM|nr:unnamed protein product [Brassica napus]CAG7895333.1 unnamed protein product [Brassica rapa]CDY48973.1 BnaA02g28230D [Brassica napus]VDC91752.1 unnamed protein product [Brassica rapa]
MRQRKVIIPCVGQRFGNEIASVPDCYPESKLLSLTGLCLSRDEAGSTLKPYCEGFVFKLQQGEKFIELLTNGSKLLPSSCAYNTFRALLLIDASV